MLTNNGGSAMTGLTFSINGDYAIADTNCNSGQTLNAQSTCYIDVSFTPGQAGPRSGSLTVTDGNLSTPLDVALSGSGEDFQLIVTGSPSAVIVSGQTATWTVQVIPVNGSAGTLTMGCSGVPQNASCTLNPATLPVASGVTGSATVTVTTGIAGTSSSATSPSDRWRTMGVALIALLPCALFGIRKRPALLRVWFVCLLAIFVRLIPVACGTRASGGGTTTTPVQPQGPATPSGVYTMNITAAIPGLQRIVPVTLTVQ